MRPAETGHVSHAIAGPGPGGRAVQVDAGDRAAEVPNAWRRRRQRCSQGARNGNYKHGRYTKEVAAARQWLREATHMLRDPNKRPG